MTGDELTAFLTVSLQSGGYTLKMSTRNSTTEAFPVPSVSGLADTVAAPGLELRPYPTPGGNVIYFERDDLQFAQLSGAMYSSGGGLTLDGAVITGGNNPQMSSDSNTLYYYSDKLYAMTRFGGASGFTQRRAAATFVPDAFVVSSDELTLFYARSPDFDISVTTRVTKDVPFEAGTVVNNINSSAVDMPMFVTADGCLLYLYSFRGGGSGSGDIWVAQRGQ